MAGFCEGSNEHSDKKIRGISRIAKALPDSQKKKTVPFGVSELVIAGLILHSPTLQAQVTLAILG